jgi:hypothetical protein
MATRRGTQSMALLEQHTYGIPKLCISPSHLIKRYSHDLSSTCRQHWLGSITAGWKRKALPLPIQPAISNFFGGAAPDRKKLRRSGCFQTDYAVNCNMNAKWPCRQVIQGRAWQPMPQNNKPKMCSHERRLTRYLKEDVTS